MPSNGWALFYLNALSLPIVSRCLIAIGWPQAPSGGYRLLIVCHAIHRGTFEETTAGADLFALPRVPAKGLYASVVTSTSGSVAMTVSTTKMKNLPKLLWFIILWETVQDATPIKLSDKTFTRMKITSRLTCRLSRRRSSRPRADRGVARNLAVA